MTPRVIGKDKRAVKRITCRNCSSIVEYVEKDVKTRSYTCMGESSGDAYVRCPSCKDAIVIPGSSW